MKDEYLNKLVSSSDNFNVETFKSDKVQKVAQILQMTKEQKLSMLGEVDRNSYNRFNPS